MSGRPHAAPCSAVGSLCFAVRGSLLFYCLGIASRMILAASCGVVAVASTSFARVSKYDASSVWVMLSISISFTSCPVDLDSAS